jgi:hypothetical protein
MPETKQRTLEELDYVFAVPTRTHQKYQVFQMLPWAFKTYVLRRKVPYPELYKFDDSEPAPPRVSEKDTELESNSNNAPVKDAPAQVS